MDNEKINFLIVFSFCVLLIIWIIVTVVKKEAVGQATNPVDFKIAQYSDGNITPNAIVKNQELEHLSFAVPERDRTFYSNQLASAYRAFKWFFEEDDAAQQKEYGTWLWTPTLQMTPEYMESTLTDLQSRGINVVYLSIDSYLDIYVLPDGEEKKENKKLFSEILKTFIEMANSKGIAVDAEAGWRNWAQKGHRYKALAIINFVKEFNMTHTSKFRGFQYDVEPYLLQEYQLNKAQVLKNFIELVDQTSFFLSSSDLKFSVVIPDFYDKRDGSTPLFSYDGHTDSALRHLLRILEEKERSSIIIMSYRNFAYGKDGSVEVSKNELLTVRRGRFSTEIIIAQETGDVPPPYITFHNKPKSYFLGEVGKLNETFGSYKNFSGIAVHYANAFLSLKPE